MFTSKYLASQLRKPSGLIGKILISRMLNRENSKMNDLTLELLEINHTDKILEVGFGGGSLLFEILKFKPKEKIYGADFSLDMVKLCKKRFSNFISKALIELDCASVENLPYKAKQFSKICTVNTIYFWKDSSIAIKELSRILINGGLLVITFGDKESMQKGEVTKHGFNLFTSLDVQKALEYEGFIVDKIKQGKDKSGNFFSISAIKKA